MEEVMTTEEYNQTIKKLVKLMNLPSVAEEKKDELAELLDRIDAYNGMDYLKVKAN